MTEEEARSILAAEMREQLSYALSQMSFALSTYVDDTDLYLTLDVEFDGTSLASSEVGISLGEIAVRGQREILEAATSDYGSIHL